MSVFEGQTYYEVLGVEPTVPVDAIRSAFRKKSRQYHPDMPNKPENAEEMSRELGRISGILMRESSRIEYNREIGLDADGHPMPSSSLPSPAEFPDFIDSDDDAPAEVEYHAEETFKPAIPQGNTEKPRIQRPQSQSPRPQTTRRTEERPQSQRPVVREEYDLHSVDPLSLVNPSKLSWKQKDTEKKKERVVMTHPGRKEMSLMTLGYVAIMLVAVALVALPVKIGIVTVLPALALLVTMGMGLHWIFTQNQISIKYVVSTAVTLISLYYVSQMAKTPELLATWKAILVGIMTLGSTYLVMLAAKKRALAEWVKSQRGPILIKNKQLLQGQIWGEVGQVGDAENFSDRNKELGVMGEEFTAEIARYLLDIPGTKVFHCLKFPTQNSHADVDHAIVNGNKVALIDSKMWAGAAYSWSDGEHVQKTVLGSNRRTSNHKVNFPFAVEQYANNAFYEADVRGWMVLYSNDGRSTKVDNSQAKWVRMVTPQRMVEEIGAWFNETPETVGVINKGLISAVIKNLK